MDIMHLRRLLKKAILYRIMKNIEDLMQETHTSHSELSMNVGQKHSWFNDAYNNNEDISLTSFTKILAYLNTKLSTKDYKIVDIFDEKILKVAQLMSKVIDEDSKNMNHFIIEEKDLFTDLIGDWGSIDAKRKLSEEEQASFENIRSIIMSVDKGAY